MRFSSAFKVGILTLVSLSILVFTVMWVKGRSLSAGDRYTIEFKDINGIRTGSAVQMMGLRIGQIEEITPIIQEENSHVDVRIVIIEPNITLPVASTISIQQSGLIGEQFLEITPPKLRTLYLPIVNKSQIIKSEDKVEMLLSSKYYDVGFIKSIEVVESNTLPLPIQRHFNSEYTYKVNYIINLPGLILPDRILGRIVSEKDGSKLRLFPFKDINIPYPETKSKYTVVEPTRIADFMELQYKAADSLTETNERISALLCDDVIEDLKSTAENLNVISVKASRTMDKVEMLIDTTRQDIDSLMHSVDKVSVKIITLSDNINSLLTDKELKTTVSSTLDSVDRLSKNLNRVLEDKSTQTIMQDLSTTMKNISEISAFLNSMSKDKKLKTDVAQTIIKFNKALDDLSITLETINDITVEDKAKIKATIQDASVISKNMKKFSERLNKRFLLFRLMF